MGRHSSGATWPFVRSVIAWALPWALAAAVAGAGLWAGVTMLGGAGEAEIAVAPSPTPIPSKPSPSPSLPQVAPTTESPPSPDKSQTPTSEVSFEGTTAQVLDATGGAAGAAESMADRLAGMGFQVVAVEVALSTYDVTTVYWTSPASRRQAEALAETNGWVAQRKPDNLSPEVQVHVVVGMDEA